MMEKTRKYICNYYSKIQGTQNKGRNLKLFIFLDSCSEYLLVNRNGKIWYVHKHIKRHNSSTIKKTWQIKEKIVCFFPICPPPGLLPVLGLLLYISTSVFTRFFLKKERNLQRILAKNRFFEFAPERWSTVLLPKNELYVVHRDGVTTTSSRAGINQSL